MAYLLPADYHKYIARPALSSDEQTQMEPYLELAEDVLNGFLGIQTLELEEDAVFVVDGTGTDTLYVGGRLIQTLTKVETLSDDQLSANEITKACRLAPNPPKLFCMDGTDRVNLYQFIDALPSYRSSLDGYFLEGVGNYRVTGTFGCNEIPPAIKSAVATIAQNLLNRQNLVEEVRSVMGTSDMTQFQDANWLIQVNLMPRIVQLMVAKWRRRSIH